MHLLRHPPVRRVPLRARPQLNEVHGLAGVALHDVADAMRQRDGVGGLLGEVRRQRAMQVLGPVHGVGVALAQSGIGHHLRHVVPELDAKPLPLNSQHAMALQVAERAVVGDEFEAVVGALEGTPGPMPAIAPVPDVGREQRHLSSWPSRRTRRAASDSEHRR